MHATTLWGERSSHFLLFRTGRVTIWLAILWVVPGTGLNAAQFDFPRVLACRDVTPIDFAEIAPGQRVVEMNLRVSVRFHDDDVHHVEELNVDVDGSGGRLRVHDFSPTTELASELADEIHQTITSETKRSLDGTLGGHLPLPPANVIAHVTPSISAGIGRRETVTESTTRLPPRAPVIVSGTTHHGQGVFFKRKRSSQTTLEGTHTFSVQFVVPEGWRGGTVYVACVAHGHDKLWGIISQEKEFGRARAPMRLHMEGDVAMQASAERRAATRRCCRPILADEREAAPPAPHTADVVADERS